MIAISTIINSIRKNTPSIPYRFQQMNCFESELQDQVASNPLNFAILIPLQDPYAQYGQNQMDH